MSLMFLDSFRQPSTAFGNSADFPIGSCQLSQVIIRYEKQRLGSGGSPIGTVTYNLFIPHRQPCRLSGPRAYDQMRGFRAEVVQVDMEARAYCMNLSCFGWTQPDQQARLPFLLPPRALLLASTAKRPRKNDCRLPAATTCSGSLRMDSGIKKAAARTPPLPTVSVAHTASKQERTCSKRRTSLAVHSVCGQAPLQQTLGKQEKEGSGGPLQIQTLEQLCA